MEEQKINKKITFSVIAVLLIALITLGATYAYFSAQAQTDTQTVTTANLKLAFEDSSSIVNASDIMPITSDKIKNAAAQKQFSIAKKTGSDDIYAKIALTDIVVSENLKDYDVKWALYQGATKVTTGTFVQTMSSNKITLANNILLNSTTPISYSLYIWIDETGVLQNNLMGGNLSAKITITGTSEKLDTLGSVILGENNDNVKTAVPTFSVNSTDKGLFVQQSNDDTNEKSEYGFPTYYYRGSVTNNYVKFGTYKTTDGGNTIGEDIIWRIVRINEDGTIKLISEDVVTSKIAWNNIEPYKSEYTSSNIKNAIETWYNNNIAVDNNLNNMVVTSTFCNDITDNYNAASTRIYSDTPVFTCPNGSILTNSKVGLITADEMMYGGGFSSSGFSKSTYLNNSTSFWTLTPGHLNEVYSVVADANDIGVLNANNTWLSSARAVINVSPDVIISSGNGLSVNTAYSIDGTKQDEGKIVEITDLTIFGAYNGTKFSEYLSTLPDNSTIILKDIGYEYKLNLLTNYDIPKNLTIVGDESATVNRILVNADPTQGWISDDGIIEGLTLSNLTFNSAGLLAGGNLKNLTVSDCIFNDGSDVLLGKYAGESSTSKYENITIKNNKFSGTGKNSGQGNTSSHVTILNIIGNVNIKNNVIDGGYSSILLNGNIAGTTNITNNILSNTENSALRFATLAENANINVTGNTIKNAIKPTTGAIARIGDNSDLPASSMVKFRNNTYDGASWIDSTWSNIQGEFGVNSDGIKVDS